MLARLVLVVCLGGCSSRSSTSDDFDPSLTDKLGYVAGKAADKAKSAGGTAADTAKNIGANAADKAKAIGGGAVDLAKAAASKAGTISGKAFDAGKRLKDDAGDMLVSIGGYDLALDTLKESDSDYAARIAGLHMIKVGDYAVAYEQDATHPLGGVYKWRFRFTWRLTSGLAVHLSIFTDHMMPEAEAAADLARLIPLAVRIATATN